MDLCKTALCKCGVDYWTSKSQSLPPSVLGFGLGNTVWKFFSTVTDAYSKTPKTLQSSPVYSLVSVLVIKVCSCSVLQTWEERLPHFQGITQEVLSINNLVFLEIYYHLCGHLSKICVLWLESKPSLSEVFQVYMSFISNQHTKTAEKYFLFRLFTVNLYIETFRSAWLNNLVLWLMAPVHTSGHDEVPLQDIFLFVPMVTIMSRQLDE